jgi:hypothetical protein
MKKVLYYEFSNKYSAHIVKHLRDAYLWEPVYMAGTNIESIRDELLSNNIVCPIQDSMKLRQAQFDYSEIGEPVPIDSDVLNSLSKYTMNFIGLIRDASGGWDFSFDERKHFYYDILKYWNTVLTNFKPDVIVFFTWPHTQSCYPLYLLCKHHFNMEVLFIDPSPLLDQNYHFVGTSLENLHSAFMDVYESDDMLLPSESAMEYLLKLRGKQAIHPKYLDDIYQRDKNTKNNLIRNFIRLVLSTCIKGTGFKIAPFDYKKNRKPYTNIKSRMNNFELLFYLVKVRWKVLKLAKIYKKFCRKPDYNKKFLFFASPYQPEAVSALNAGVNEELFIVLDNLSDNVPDDWVIYYKEHPSIFLEHFQGCYRRNQRVYERIQAYKNIQMIPSETDTTKLIDNSQAVCTVGGTTGWESIARGKPALAFGSVWYQGCNSIFTVNSSDDVKNAISAICNGFLPDEKDIERYTASIEKVATKGIIMDNFHQEILKVENPKFEMERLADMIYQAYETNYG